MTFSTSRLLLFLSKTDSLTKRLNSQEGLCDGKSITPAQLEGIVEQLNLVARYAENTPYLGAEGCSSNGASH